MDRSKTPSPVQPTFDSPAEGTLTHLIEAAILGTGSYLPEKVMTNDDLAKIVETNDEWITTRTGIKERHVASESQATSDLAFEAGRKALESAGLQPSDLDLIIVATLSPDTITPATSCYVQAKLGADKAAAFDISAACSGFIYGLGVAKAFVASGIYRHVLLIGAEKLTSYVDWTDRTTCVLFGDGAGAVVVGPAQDGRGVIVSTYLSANGNENKLISIPGGGSRLPASEKTVAERQHFLKMGGRETYKCAVTYMPAAIHEVLKMAGVDIADVSLVIPHQANLRIIEAIRERMNLTPEKVFVNVDKTGNTSAATIGIGLDEVSREGRLKKGDNVVLVAFGAGLTVASALIRW
jgi:3-oxoacyl-[acyl-carrier-protein] synthase-3